MNAHSHDVEDATVRLVRSITGHADADSIALATKIAASTMGAASASASDTGDLSSAWRKMERNSADDRCKCEVEALYNDISQLYIANGDVGTLPEDIVRVMVKLMGNQRTQNAKPKPNSTRKAPGTQSRRYHAHPSASDPENSVLRQEFLTSLAVEEGELLREIIYALQGIDGERIRFCWPPNDNDNTAAPLKKELIKVYQGARVRSSALGELQLPPDMTSASRLGSGAVDAIRICAEAGWLYRRVQTYVQTQHRGSVCRALASALFRELQSYREFLAHLEASIPFSLRQILAETRMPTTRLKSLAVLTDGLATLTGGPLLTALHLHALHGDTRHASLVRSLLASASRPWFDMLWTWTTQGVLSDPTHEFFVVDSQDVHDLLLWHERYRIERSNIPKGILDQDLIEPAFNVGKGINFIRKCLLDGEWAMEFESSEDMHNVQDRVALGYCFPSEPSSDTTSSFRSTLEKAATLVHSHILFSLKEDHSLLLHLFALKQFLLLGQGDFFSALMDGIHADFGERTGVVGIYRHSLAIIVESALRSTNASDFPPHILKRVQVELLLDADDDTWFMFGPTSKEKEEVDERTVWDIFALEYTVPDPLSAVVHPAAMKNYNLMFRFLFSLKKVEFMLNYTWRQSAVLTHGLHTSAQYNGINVSTSSAYAQSTVLLRKISMTRQSMMHFVTKLKSYLMFEVLEGGWTDLARSIEDATTLDEVVQAHDRYLNGICRKSLLQPSKVFGDKIDLGQQLSVLLRLSNEFSSYQEKLFGDAQEAADRASAKRQEAEERLKEGGWGFKTEQEVSEEESFFGLADVSKLHEVDRLAEAFNQQVLTLLRVLDSKVNGGPATAIDTPPATPIPVHLMHRQGEGIGSTDDQDDLDSLRFLTLQLDHNDFYGVHMDT
jgi:gamma-tubulin complex component 3